MWRYHFMARYGLTDSQLLSLEKYLKILSAAQDDNLTAVSGAENIINVHFCDSLSLLDFPKLNTPANAVDIGSGAGLPGIPLAIARPDLKITLLESSKKKSNFISLALQRLGLANARVLNMRAEEAGRSSLRESFDLAFARAVGPLPVVLEYSLPLLARGGLAILQRGRRIAGDEEKAQRASSILGGSLVRITPVLPYAGARHLHVWVFKKKTPTPNRFPRKPGIARKRPLS
jgi:16S rRNA (guanine527-N7)-methyltransferase